MILAMAGPLTIVPIARPPNRAVISPARSSLRASQRITISDTLIPMNGKTIPARSPPEHGTFTFAERGSAHLSLLLLDESQTDGEQCLRIFNRLALSR